MNCGIEVLKRLNELIEVDLSEVIQNCEHLVDEQGLSMLIMKQQLEQVVPCQAIASLKLIKKTPYIAFIGPARSGHYMLVEKVDKKVIVFDPAHCYFQLSRSHFYMLWSKKALLIG